MWVVWWGGAVWASYQIRGRYCNDHRDGRPWSATPTAATASPAARATGRETQALRHAGRGCTALCGRPWWGCSSNEQEGGPLLRRCGASGVREASKQAMHAERAPQSRRAAPTARRRVRRVEVWPRGGWPGRVGAWVGGVHVKWMRKAQALAASRFPPRREDERSEPSSGKPGATSARQAPGR